MFTIMGAPVEADFFLLASLFKLEVPLVQVGRGLSIARITEATHMPLPLLPTVFLGVDFFLLLAFLLAGRTDL